MSTRFSPSAIGGNRSKARPPRFIDPRCPAVHCGAGNRAVDMGTECLGRLDVVFRPAAGGRSGRCPPASDRSAARRPKRADRRSCNGNSRIGGGRNGWGSVRDRAAYRRSDPDRRRETAPLRPALNPVCGRRFVAGLTSDAVSESLSGLDVVRDGGGDRREREFRPICTGRISLCTGRISPCRLFGRIG